MPTVYAITPTYARATQRVDLISLCHTLMHVPNITWIVIEDSVNKTQLVRDVLTKQCMSVTSVHLATRSPKPLAKGRGINQRNAGLSWIRQKCGSGATEKCRGVVYMMDDDNKYDLRLFHEVGNYYRSYLVYFLFCRCQRRNTNASTIRPEVRYKKSA